MVTATCITVGDACVRAVETRLDESWATTRTTLQSRTGKAGPSSGYGGSQLGRASIDRPGGLRPCVFCEYLRTAFAAARPLASTQGGRNFLRVTQSRALGIDRPSTLYYFALRYIDPLC